MLTMLKRLLVTHLFNTLINMSKLEVKEFSGVIKIYKSKELIYENACGFADIVNEHLTCDNFDENVTIKHRLTHTSGLPDYFYEDFTEISMDMLPNNCAHGYEENHEGTLKTNIFSIPIVGGGDGGVFVTADDLNKLWDGLLTYKLLKEDITKELLTPQSHVGDNCYYGYGIFMITRDKEVYKYFISGGDPGVSFESTIYLKDDIEITILGNRKFNISELLSIIENID